MRHNTDKQIPRLAALNDPTVLRINPTLAAKIGLNESIMLLQIDYLIGISNTEIIKGRPWTFQSIRDLQEKYFPFWSKDTINRTIASLQKMRLIRCANFNSAKYDKTRWVSINYAKVERLGCVAVLSQNATRSTQIETTLSQNETRKQQNATRSTQIETAIPETSTETSTEISSETTRENKEPRAEDNPLSKPRLKPNASALCSEAMDAFNSQILKRKAQPDYTMWPAWVALAGDEQAAFETVMGIIYASKIPDGPRLPFQLDGVFRDPARAAYWRAQYKPTKSEHEWLESGDQERIISTVARILKNNGTVPKEAESWIPQAQQRLTKHLVA